MDPLFLDSFWMLYGSLLLDYLWILLGFFMDSSVWILVYRSLSMDSCWDSFWDSFRDSCVRLLPCGFLSMDPSRILLKSGGGGGGFLPNVPADPHGNSFRIFSCDSVKTLRGSSPQGSTLAAPNLSVRNRISKKVAWTHSTNPQLEILRDPHRIPLRRSSTIDHDLTGILRPDADWSHQDHHWDTPTNAIRRILEKFHSKLFRTVTRSANPIRLDPRPQPGIRI